jgi:O-antigen/teichoic acid export membrane protein
LAEGVSFYPLLFLSLLSASLSPLYLFYQQWLRCKQDSISYVTNSFLCFAISTILSIIAISYLKLGVLGMILSTTITSLIFFLYSMLKFLPYVQLGLNLKVVKEAYLYSLPLVPHSLTGYLSVMLDRVMLNKLIGPEQLGFYSIANQYGSILSFVTTSINQAFSPWMMEEVSAGRKQNQSMSQFAYITTILTCIVAFLITLYSPDLIRLMATESYKDSWQPVILISFGYVFNGLYYFFSSTLFLSHTNYVMSISIVTLIVNLLLNTLLIPSMGIIGAGLSFCLSMLVSSFVSMILSIKLEPEVKFYFGKMYFVVFVFIALSFSVFGFELIGGSLQLIYKTILALIVSLSFALTYRRFIVKVVNGIKQKIYVR